MERPMIKNYKDINQYDVDLEHYAGWAYNEINSLKQQLEKEREEKFTRKDMIDFGYKCSPTMASPDSALKQVKLIFENYYSQNQTNDKTD